MTSKEVRSSFLDYFNEKGHKIVTSAPIVVKNDPTLMFTNAGMNQFKDYFLGHSKAPYHRIANTQKCLRVSGKHNDLEEVGHDTYHHTMFEMLGNWSFGDYFKKEAIDWAWDFLVNTLKIEKDRLYATVFGGDTSDKLDMDKEAFGFWNKHLPEEKILSGSKKDNFWEMGETGPCGPCSEIHIDLRNNNERRTKPGKHLVNKDHPLVIEIWNLVFIQFNRKADGSLENLPNTHIDTGMGFERLCMVMQNKTSNYDTDIFQDIISRISEITGIQYGENEKTDIAMRVVSDHLRAVSFSIADGQIPSNNKAGYVIRRILRRAIRYAFSFLDQKKPFIHKLVDILSDSMGGAFPEITDQKNFIIKVIKEEEISFLKTLENGIKRLSIIVENARKQNIHKISGKDVFELYDTYGFPVDLTQLILRENGMDLDQDGFNKELEKQKNRSKQDAQVDTDDWITVLDNEKEEFVGYNKLQTNVLINKYRRIKTKGKDLYQLVFNVTPFYAESGGQVGDKGYIENDAEKIEIIDTIKENNVNIHITKKLPENVNGHFIASVDSSKRIKTACNHTATHLLHLALRKVLGDHVEQRGSLVHPDYLRFDFSHFQKMTDEEIEKVEKMVNKIIRTNIQLVEMSSIPMEKAREMGAMALFGEKYEENVRVIKFGDSIELCGGTHVDSTGQIGSFRIIKESAIAAGIRRIEAITSVKAEEYINKRLHELEKIESLFKNPKNIIQSIENLIYENEKLRKEIESLNKQKIGDIKKELISGKKTVGDIDLITGKIDVSGAADMKDIAFQLKGQISNLVLIMGAEINGKANLSVMISDHIVKEKKLNASEIIKEIAKEIQGGGGGQPFFATAGGKNISGIDKALEKATEIVENKIIA